MFPLSSGVVLPPGSAAELVLAASAPSGEAPAGRTASSWAREVAQVRERGLAFEYGQCVSSLSCVSAPILSATGQVVAAVAATSLEAGQIAPLGESVARAAAMISANLSRRPPSGARPHREWPARPAATPAPHPVLAGPH